VARSAVLAESGGEVMSRAEHSTVPGISGNGRDPEAARLGRLIAVVAEQQQDAGAGMQAEMRILLDYVHAAAVVNSQRRRDHLHGEDAGNGAASLGQ